MKTFQTLSAGLRYLGAAMLALFAFASHAGTADVSSVPPATLSSATVRPNLMFVLDDSGSMGWNYLPDSVGAESDFACYGFSGHNRVAYDPTITYTLPSNGNGGTKGAASFTAAHTDGFSGSGNVDLSKAWNRPYAYVTSESQDQCSYWDSSCTNSTTTIDSTGRFTDVSVTSCSKRTGLCTRTTKLFQTYYYARLSSGTTDDCSLSGASKYTIVTSISSADQQNYANWYQYYRTRMLMMRSAAGRVFDAIDPTRFRLGFATISSGWGSDASDFLNMADMDSGSGSSSQKAKFFTRLYGQAPGGSTPLRPALVQAGNYFAHKITGQTVDPMQYSCQRNYTLLSTDGYWNTAGEPSSYKPKRLDGATDIGDVDGVAGTPRPKLDVTGAQNSLADIAKYFYDTDIRDQGWSNCTGSVSGQNVCTNRQPRPGDTSPLFQNMSTYTLGLGVPGVLNYQTNYDTAASGDFQDVIAGSKNWPNPLSSSNGGLANSSSTVTARIDDLWHAAVNAGGRYYSAGNPTELVLGLTDALDKINVETDSNSAAASSSLQPVVTTDFAFLPAYETRSWTGNLSAFRYTTDTSGKLSLDNTASWQAAQKLASQSSRNVYFFNASSSNKLSTFAYGNLSSAQKAYFDNLCLAGSYKLSQCGSLTATALTRVTGTNVVAYLAGSRSYETSQSAADDRVFRSRQNAAGNYWTPLGDIVNSAPTYVGPPPFGYTDSGYSTFAANQHSRTAVVYVGANDGMLHAFRASDGYELWAYVPSQVMPNMYQLADQRYGTAHRYFVDATPTMADVYDATAGAWKTVLIGGLRGGGKGYYALDITDPNNPKALWEFADSNMGLSFGRPLIGKNKNGKWIVAFTSGYNNTDGDGNGRLYVLDAITGAVVGTPLQTLTSGGLKVGSTTTPNNLGPLAGWVDNDKSVTIERFYAGDMLGNIWRFDYDDKVLPSGAEATLLGVATGPTGATQPITVAPMLNAVGSGNSTIPLVTVATGRYLGASDLGDTAVQTIYTIKDSLGATGYGNLRDDTNMVRQTLSADGALTANSVNWNTNDGWWMDFSKNPGERVNVEMDSQLGTVTVASTIPTPTPCSPGGTSRFYKFALDGRLVRFIPTTSLIVGVVEILATNGGQSVQGTLITYGDGKVEVDVPPPPPPGNNPPPSGGGVRRTSWRELIN